MRDQRATHRPSNLIEPEPLAKTKKRWGGDVAPSCARRCAGSRLPDHARCSFFVRSRHRARVRPRRAIRLFAGSMWRAHQHSHNHVCTRTNMATQHGRTRSRSGKRATSTTHLSRNMRYTSTSRTKAIAAGCSRLTATLLPALLPACCHCTTLPHMPSHAPPYCTLLCRARVCALYRTPCSQCPLGPPGRFARIHCGRCTGSALVCLACSCYDRVGNRLLVVCFRLLLLSVAFSCCAQYRSYHTTPRPAHNTHLTQNTHTTCTSTPLAPYTPCTSHTLHLPPTHHA